MPLPLGHIAVDSQPRIEPTRSAFSRWKIFTALSFWPPPDIDVIFGLLLAIERQRLSPGPRTVFVRLGCWILASKWSELGLASTAGFGAAFHDPVARAADALLSTSAVCFSGLLRPTGPPGIAVKDVSACF